MIQSMTGYGKATATFGDKKINVEIKSLNSKAMDLSTRIAPLYREKEMEIRNLITKTLERGKVDFTIKRSNTSRQVHCLTIERLYFNVDFLIRQFDGCFAVACHRLYHNVIVLRKITRLF